MNPQNSTFRTLIAIGAGLALTLAACSGDDDTATTTAPATETTDDAESGDTPAMQPASITFDAQTSDGSTITVSAVELPADGFVAVHSDGDGSPGPVIGVSDLLPSGDSADIEITLDAPLTSDTTLYPMVHIDTNSNGVYEFGEVDGVDGPGLTADDDVAVVNAAVTLEGESAEGSGDESAAADGTTITIADFAFDGITEVALGTTVVVTNTDSAPHTWTAVDGAFDSGSLGQGETFEFTFDTAGEFEYFCNFHPSMTGTITVTG